MYSYILYYACTSRVKLNKYDFSFFFQLVSHHDRDMTLVTQILWGRTTHVRILPRKCTTALCGTCFCVWKSDLRYHKTRRKMSLLSFFIVIKIMQMRYERQHES